MPKIYELEMILRERNQVTLPAQAVEQFGLHPGDRVVLELVEGQETAIVRPLRRSYAGALAGVYGTPEQVAAYVTGERRAWD